MGNQFSCFQGDSKKPSKKHVEKKPDSTTTVTFLSTINEILRRYSLYTAQRRKHHGFWGKQKVYPQEDSFKNKLPKYCEPWPDLEVSEESAAFKGREDGERLVNARVVEVAPLGCDSSKYSGITCQESNLDAQKAPCGDPVQDIPNEDTVYENSENAVYDIANEDTIYDITNEDTVYDITNEDAAYNTANEDIGYNITNEDAVQDICKKEDAAKEPFILENDLIVESISDEEDFSDEEVASSPCPPPVVGPSSLIGQDRLGTQASGKKHKNECKNWTSGDTDSDLRSESLCCLPGLLTILIIVVSIVGSF
ncbi:PREDICTED: uncharacterized protein LOC105522283 [Colobus angolensis palliatus]|uniref:uncharacterized protein LOC105522283 n=1 Tax=Colobus angolensis palliatus TaxID=336983 RepID=UPI0005F3B471|nr:PREDICTED: uncharacterized protein LOC105522283 [Colobus angolensis palliatus]